MVNRDLCLIENREKLKNKVIEFCSRYDAIDNDRIGFCHDEEDNQISIRVCISDDNFCSFECVCNELIRYIEDELSIVCYDAGMEDDDTYWIIILYDEISNESESIINEILDVLNRYDKRIDIQYDNDSAYISWD